MSALTDIYHYRELLKTNVKKDIRGKYKGSYLGVLWSFIAPLLQVVVYWIVFPYLMRNTVDNYLIYLITGVMPWNFFVTIVSAGTGCVKANEAIIKKVYFPREILFLSQVLSGLVNFFISCIIVLVFCLGSGVGISVHIICVPLIALIEALLIFGSILLLGSVNVYVQDVQHIITFVLNMMFYGTPILYTLDSFNSANILVQLVKLNPMTSVLDAYRAVFLYHEWPDFLDLFFVFLLGCLLTAVGYLVFRKLEKGFAEVL